MRTYRAFWMLWVSLVTSISLVLGWWQEGAWLVLAEVIVFGVMGTAFGASWEEDPALRWQVGRVWALRGIVMAVVLTGLPHLIGAWSLLVLMALAALSPATLIAVARRGRRQRTPPSEGALRGLSDDELARRWRSSSAAVRSSWRTPTEVLDIVVERHQLLDELELRDPERFTRWLVAAGWRESPSR